MARRPTLEIDGVVYTNVYEVSYELRTSKDETGRPSDCARAGTIKILRESDDHTEIAAWAMNSEETNWKTGKVTFRKPDDSVMKELTWEEGFITKYEERIPHIKDRSSEQVQEYFEISSHFIQVGEGDSGKIDNRWQE
ncbi:MAG: type VI secretion system tube protein TssD [candidate division Zixibacteria bacterium]|nr:type VI secretion system tube protein TssD [candidate division Zixibacteria bacterium]